MSFLDKGQVAKGLCQVGLVLASVLPGFKNIFRSLGRSFQGRLSGGCDRRLCFWCGAQVQIEVERFVKIDFFRWRTVVDNWNNGITKVSMDDP